jgi:hypothetical protein
VPVSSVAEWRLQIASHSIGKNYTTEGLNAVGESIRKKFRRSRRMEDKGCAINVFLAGIEQCCLNDR